MNTQSDTGRMDYLDAVRAFALLLGIVFHASLSFMPMYIGWAVMDVSTSSLVPIFMHVSHSFRMELFFLIAGFFGHLTFHRKGAGAFLKSRFVRIVIPFVVGWFILKPLIISGWIMGGASLRGDVDVMFGLREGFRTLETLPSGIFVGSHLWFLYYMVLVTAALLLARGLVKLSGSWHEAWLLKLDAVMGWLAKSRLAVFVLAIPTAGAVWFMSYWGVDTPDKSLMPHIPTLLLYGGFFGFGWLLHRSAGLLAELARVTIVRWIVLGASAVVSLYLTGMQGETDHPQYVWMHAAFVVSFAVMMWLLVLLTIGVFARVCRRKSPVIRYVADSSYWLYLVHLPIVIWLQVAVAEWPAHWSLKLVGVSLATILFSLFTYDLFVRSTFIGKILSGSRRSRVFVGTRQDSGTGRVSGSVEAS